VTIVRVGTNQKYSDGWETAFSKKKSAKAQPARPRQEGFGQEAAKKSRKVAAA
jgi:hypothetical protein